MNRYAQASAQNGNAAMIINGITQENLVVEVIAPLLPAAPMMVETKAETVQTTEMTMEEIIVMIVEALTKGFANQINVVQGREVAMPV
jgi:hypothetical protein